MPIIISDMRASYIDRTPTKERLGIDHVMYAYRNGCVEIVSSSGFSEEALSYVESSGIDIRLIHAPTVASGGFKYR